LVGVVFVFDYMSILGNYYCAESNIGYIKNIKVALFIFRFAVLVMVIFGSVAAFDLVWALADITIAIMALINLYAITRLSKIAIRVLKDYRDQRKAGKDPVFYRDALEDESGVEF